MVKAAENSRGLRDKLTQTPRTIRRRGWKMGRGHFLSNQLGSLGKVVISSTGSGA